jgi:hypothetical protein
MSVPFSSRLRGIPVALLVCASTACGGDAPEAEPDDAGLVPPPAAMPTSIIMEPAEGATLPAGDIRVVLGAENIMILPAGDTTANSGHHHLILNAPVPAVGAPIPPAGTEGYTHLGQAQTEYVYTGLPAGSYTLVAVLGDMVHQVLPQMSDTVHFTVTGP